MYIGLKKEKLLWMAGEIHIARRRIREALDRIEHDEDKEFFRSCYRYELECFKQYDKFYLFEHREFLNAIREGDHESISEAMTFLEADPYCFRSGYMKKKICSALKNAPLFPEEKEKVRQLILEILLVQRPVSFGDFVSLGCRLYTPEFHAQVTDLKVPNLLFLERRKKFFLLRLKEEAEKQARCTSSNALLPPSAPSPGEKEKPLLKRLLGGYFKLFLSSKKRDEQDPHPPCGQ